MMSAVYDDGFLYVYWSATPIKCDYGVSGSPVWYEPDEPEVESIEVLGQDMNYEELPDYMRDAVDQTFSKVEWGF